METRLVHPGRSQKQQATGYTIDDEPAIDVIKKFLGKGFIIDDKLIGLDTHPLH